MGEPPPDLTLARTILLLVENLGNVTSRFKSDQLYNLLQKVGGAFSWDKDALMAILRRFIHMSPGHRGNFQVGKRFG